jgi:hypothetical protein
MGSPEVGRSPRWSGRVLMCGESRWRVVALLYSSAVVRHEAALSNRPTDAACWSVGSAERERLSAERDKIASEQDEAPAPAGARTSDRSERPGAPLWDLVRFADEVSQAEAAREYVGPAE